MKTPSAAKKIEPPTILDPALFRALETICREAIGFGGNHPAVRQSVRTLVGSLRLIARTKYGHDTPEVAALVQMLRRTDPTPSTAPLGRPAPERDPITELSTPFGRRRPKLTPEQAAAAGVIRSVWSAFGRFLIVGSGGTQSAGRRSRMLDPVQVMGVKLLNLYWETYVPWYEAAKYRMVPCKRTGRVHTTEVVFHAVVYAREPKLLDQTMRLRRGTALKILQSELTLFNSHYDTDALKTLAKLAKTKESEAHESTELSPGHDQRQR